MKAKKGYTLRKFINDIHLWLGIGSGIIIFLVCLSGTILVFDKEIKAVFTEDIQFEESNLPPMDFDALKASIAAEGLGELKSMTIDEEEDFHTASIQTGPEDRRGTSFLVHPQTGEVMAAPESSASGFMMAMFRMHRWLLLDSAIGRPIVGVATIIFILLSISGLVLWFPKKLRWKNLKSGFKIRTDASWKRVNHDLHNTLGFYSLILIIIMCLTGLCWSFEGYRELASNVLGTKVFNRGGGPTYAALQLKDEEKVGLQEVYELTQIEFPYEGKISISLPSEENPVYSIRKYDSSSFSPVIADNLVVNEAGEIEEKVIFSEKPMNEQVASLIKPIHLGEIYGTFSKVIYFIACLIATSLPVTGTIIWLNKLKKKNKKKKKKSPSTRPQVMVD